jgi:hypothetical protein
VNETVEDGIGDGGLADVGVPSVDGELSGNESGPASVAVFEDFKEVAALLVRERGDAPVVNDEDIGLGEAG